MVYVLADSITCPGLFSNTSVNDIIAFIKDTHFYNRI